MPLATITTVLETTNCSGKNDQPPEGSSAPPLKKKRGTSALLQDVTNNGIHRETRHSAARAKRAMVTKSHAYAPRGNPGHGGRVRHTNISEMAQPRMLLTSELHETLGGYIQRNVTYEI